MSTVEDDEQDLTRKQRREQARAQRKAMEEAEAASAVRRTRLIRLGIVIGAVIVIVAAILIATSGGSKKGIPTSSAAVNKVSSEVDGILAGIPQNGSTIGNPNAPVTLQYYGDLQCPVCKAFTLGALPPLIEKYVRSGKLKIEYRSLETATREPETFKTQQVAALAAGKQAKMWNYLELFYHEQGQEGTEYVTESYLQKLAQQIPGLNLQAWTQARSSGELANVLANDAQAANNVGFTGTPSFLIGKTGGSSHKLEYTSLTDPSSFEAAIEQQLKS
jgi:protein-disulfide isomerase